MLSVVGQVSGFDQHDIKSLSARSQSVPKTPGIFPLPNSAPDSLTPKNSKSVRSPVQLAGIGVYEGGGGLVGVGSAG